MCNGETSLVDLSRHSDLLIRSVLADSCKMIPQDPFLGHLPEVLSISYHQSATAQTALYLPH